MTDTKIDPEKAAYAALLLSESDPFKAALTLFPNPSDLGKALRIAQEWAKDPLVIAEKERLNSDECRLEQLPGKSDLALAIWNRLNHKHTDNEDFAKLAKLYADMRGYIAKPETNINVHANVDNRVMRIKDLGSDKDWEAKAERQQRELLNVSTSRH